MSTCKMRPTVVGLLDSTMSSLLSARVLVRGLRTFFFGGGGGGVLFVSEGQELFGF